MTSRLRRALSAARHPIATIRELAAAVMPRPGRRRREPPRKVSEAPPPPAGRPHTFAEAAPGWRAAAAAVDRAAGTDPVTPDMVTLAPWSMTESQFAEAPGYHVILSIQVDRLAEPVHRTVTGVTELPATKDDLIDWAWLQALAMAEGTVYGGALGGIPVAILGVTITVGPSLAGVR